MNDLISELVSDLQPVRRLRSVRVRSLVWMVVSLAVIAIGMVLYQPFRPGVALQLLESPLYLSEMLFGYLTVLCASVSCFALAVPGAKESSTFQRLTLLFGVLWILSFLYQLIFPSFPPSMIGKRGACVYEVLAYGLVLNVTFFLLLRKSAFSELNWVALVGGLSCGLIPAVTMEMACMYLPSHSLLFHILPAFVIAGVGVLTGKLLLQRL